MSAGSYVLKPGDTIAGRYVIRATVGVGGMGAVFRAMPFHDPSQDVAIKIIRRRKALGPDDILRFQKEAALMSLLHHPNIICFHELGILGSKPGWQIDNGQTDIGDGYYIVMEYSEGRDLKRSLTNTGRKDLPYFFEVALQVASALDYTHGKNIIHRDIKPHNIVIGKTFREQKGFLVKVLDFGVARLAELTDSASAETVEGKHPEVAGTPMYMSPEQTPYFNATIDHRVDLYSFGCVLYEVLAGRPPFEDESRDKMMAKHAKTKPEPLSLLRPDVPEIIDHIILKLLEKHPDDRYQTAFGLYADLQRARIQLFETKRRKVFFPLGLKDSFKAVSAQLPLVGRDSEMSVLKTSYDSVSSSRGRSHMAVIKGGAGMGKTRLLAEFRNVLIRSRTRFISVKFSRHENNLPYNALANGFNEYLMQVLKRQPKEAEALKRRIRASLGDMAHFIADKVPGLRPFIDPTLQRPNNILQYGELDAEEIEKREFQNFAKAFSDFTRCLAVDNLPIVFIFDDMHWADHKSLALVDQFFSHNNSMRFYLILSYRTENSGRSVLSRLLDKFKRLKRRYSETELLPLEENHLNTLVGKMLDSPFSVTNDFVRYLKNETQGIPMSAVELVRSLVAQELINYNNITGLWDINLKQITSVHLKLDSIDLTLSRIQAYDAAGRSILEVASLIGMSFQSDLLQLGEPETRKIAENTIQKAIDDGLVVRTSDDKEFSHLGKSFMFIHPTVREAISDAIAPEQLCLIHMRLAHIIESQSKANHMADSVLFSIVHHFNEAMIGGISIGDSDSRFGVHYNVEAGQAALRKSSYNQAKNYFEQARTLMNNMGDLSTVAAESLKLTEHLADIEYHLRNPQAAVKLYAGLLQTPLDRIRYAQIVNKMVHVTIYGGRLSQSMEWITRSLQFMQYPRIRSTTLDKVKAWFRLAIDSQSLSIQSNRLYRLVHRAYTLGISYQEGEPRGSRYWGLNLYRHAQQILRKENPQLAFLYQETCLEQCFQKGVSPVTILKTVSDRANLIAQFGPRKLAFSITDIAADIAKSLGLESALGYILLYQILQLEYYAGKLEDHDKRVRSAMSLLSRSYDSIHYAYARIFLLHFDLLKGNFDRIDRAVIFLWSPELPYRNWLNPRGYAPYALGLFLRNDRHRLVQETEKYLQCLTHSKFRKSDIFLQIIKTILSSARGETRKASAYFMNIFSYYLKPSGIWTQVTTRQWFLPFEEDFILLFLSFFSDFHASNHGSPLLPEDHQAKFYDYLGKRSRHPSIRNRAIGMMVKARCQELASKKKAKESYLKSIKVAIAGSQPLLSAISQYWYGLHIVSRHNKTSEYLAKAQREAHRLGLDSFVAMIEQSAQKHGMTLTSLPPANSQLEGLEVSDKLAIPELCSDHLNLLAEKDISDKQVDGDFESSLKLLERHYDIGSVYLISLLPDRAKYEVINSQPELISKEKSAQLLQYASPYMNLESPLFLPAIDAPWLQNRVGKTFVADSLDASGETFIPSKNSLDQTSINPLSNELTLPDQTIVMDQPSIDMSQSKGPPTLRMIQATISEDQAGTIVGDAPALVEAVRHVNALIPLYFQGTQLGLLFLERLVLGDKVTARIRQDLDYFGGQLSTILAASHNRLPYHSSEFLHFAPGTFALQSCSWLNLWTFGKLRKTRESVFYFGVNTTDDDYLLLYTKITGEGSQRELLSAILWRQLCGITTRNCGSDSSRLSEQELKDEILKMFRSFPAFAKMDELFVTFSLFNRLTTRVSSGQFGLTRAYVIGTENKVSPDNAAAFSLENGQIIRYWRVEGELGMGRFYLLPHEASQLDRLTDIRLAKSAQALTRGDLEKILDQELNAEKFPRYYVSACMKDPDADHDSDQTASIKQNIV